MTRTRPPEDHRRDLDTREQIADFVTRFYREVAQDDRFDLYFETIAHIDWHAHTRDLTDFWVGVLLGEPHSEADDVIEAHRWLNDTAPFDGALFEHWLDILDATLDDGWNGPMTEQARRRGHGYAWAMAKRLADTDLRLRPGAPT